MIAIIMSSRGARSRLWLRYLSAVAVLFWAVSLGAGCHFVHMTSAAPAVASASTTQAGHEMSGVTASQASNAHAWSPIVGGCLLILRMSPTTGAAGLVVAVAIAALAGVMAGSAMPPTRGPPFFHALYAIRGRSGRSILIRFCTARI